MAAKSKNRTFMPGSTWEVIKKVVRAYHAAADQDDPSGEDLSELSGLARPVISTNTNFLREVGILRQDMFKLTETGSRFAVGMEMNDDSMIRSALQEGVQESSQIRDLLIMLRARGPLAVQSFKNEIMLKVGLSKDSWQAPFVKTLLDFLQEAKQIEIRPDDTVAVVIENKRKVEDTVEFTDSASASVQKTNPPRDNSGGHKIPLPLGPNRLAHLELPPDWEQKELRKLIKLLEIALGDDEEVAKS